MLVCVDIKNKSGGSRIPRAGPFLSPGRGTLLCSKAKELVRGHGWGCSAGLASVQRNQRHRDCRERCEGRGWHQEAQASLKGAGMRAGLVFPFHVVFVEARLCARSTQAVGSVDFVPRALSVRQKLFES